MTSNQPGALKCAGVGLAGLVPVSSALGRPFTINSAATRLYEKYAEVSLQNVQTIRQPRECAPAQLQMVQDQACVHDFVGKATRTLLDLPQELPDIRW